MRIKLLLKSLMIGFAALCLCQAQSSNSPSLAETFDWMANTLKSTEGNNILTHRPHKVYPQDWLDKGIDPYHSEVITDFSHQGCRVEFRVDVIDNDPGLMTLGKKLVEHDVDTFDLRDIDPESVRVRNSCEPTETPDGPTTPKNCEDEQGKIIIFQTSDAKAKIHEERSNSSGKSTYGWNQVLDHAEHNLDEMCKAVPGNPAYCDQPEHKGKPADLTSLTLGFSTPGYAKRFAKAFKHAAELCGGKQSAF